MRYCIAITRGATFWAGEDGIAIDNVRTIVLNMNPLPTTEQRNPGARYSARSAATGSMRAALRAGR